jgi:aryl-alcohol dehydrogenase-like predicted oxidoreductase
VLGKLKLSAYPRRVYDVATMRRALHASLRALRTDYIDIYHVHDPLPDSAIGDDLVDALLRVKAAGLVRRIGVAGGTIDTMVARYGEALDVFQSAESSWSEARYVPDITHSLFSEAARHGPLDEVHVRSLLTRALARRPEGAVIVQTRDPARLDRLVAIADEA